MNLLLARKNIYLYYGFLILILIFLTGSNAPSLIFRIGYISAVFAPFLFIQKDLFPAILALFYTVGVNGANYGFLPYMLVFYAMISFVIVVANKNNRLNKEGFLIFLFLTYVFTINMMNGSSSVPAIVYALIILFFFTLLIKNRVYSSKLLTLIFPLASLFLSVIYLLNYRRFAISFGDDFERAYWKDPNYLSGIIGMGIIVSLIMLLKNNRLNIYKRFILILTVMLSFLVQMMMASRGAVVATCATLIFLLLFMRIKRRYKFLFIVFFAAFILVLYQYDVFELLRYRFLSDNGTGSGRTEIWSKKLFDFFDTSNIFQIFFGVGYDKTLKLGGQIGAYLNGVGCHNDFIALFCNYGITGLSLFLLTVYYILKISTKQIRSVVVAFIVYLFLCMCTIEPLSAGSFTYWAFYYMTYLYAKSSKEIEWEKGH